MNKLIPPKITTTKEEYNIGVNSNKLRAIEEAILSGVSRDLLLREKVYLMNEIGILNRKLYGNASTTNRGKT